MDIREPFNAWAAQVQQPGNVSIDEATDIVQTFAPSLSDADGNAWWDALGAEWGRLAIITPGTYVGLRNFTNNNEQGATDLFEALLTSVNFLPESAPVNAALALGTAEQQLAAIPGNQAIIEGNKTGGSTIAEVQLDQAYQIAIDALETLASQLQDQIQGASP